MRLLSCLCGVVIFSSFMVAWSMLMVPLIAMNKPCAEHGGNRASLPLMVKEKTDILATLSHKLTASFPDVSVEDGDASSSATTTVKKKVRFLPGTRIKRFSKLKRFAHKQSDEAYRNHLINQIYSAQAMFNMVNENQVEKKGGIKLSTGDGAKGVKTSVGLKSPRVPAVDGDGASSLTTTVKKKVRFSPDTCIKRSSELRRFADKQTDEERHYHMIQQILEAQAKFNEKPMKKKVGIKLPAGHGDNAVKSSVGLKSPRVEPENKERAAFGLKKPLETQGGNVEGGRYCWEYDPYYRDADKRGFFPFWS